MGLFSHRIHRKSLKAGDHIYTYRGGGIYAHHGIYVGRDKVIHFTREGEKPSISCSLQKEGFGIVSSSLNSFLSGGNLRRFEYGVGRFLFLVKVRGGTCTMADSDPDDVAIHRAKYLLTKGFGCYNLFRNNCENFAIYCKTGLVMVTHGIKGQSGQVVSFFARSIAIFHSTLCAVGEMIFLPSTLEMIALGGLVVISMPLATILIVAKATATGVAIYSAHKYAADIGVRSDVKKVPVEDV